MLLWATLVVFVLLALVGCAASEGDADVPVTDPVDRQELEFGGTNAEIGMVTVNGVTCVVVDGVRTNGVTCDWEGSR